MVNRKKVSAKNAAATARHPVRQRRESPARAHAVSISLATAYGGPRSFVSRQAMSERQIRYALKNCRAHIAERAGMKTD
jgi:hypothetical protein